MHARIGKNALEEAVILITETLKEVPGEAAYGT
jgi:hypothetical protein